jgi:hypothetical protein
MYSVMVAASGKACSLRRRTGRIGSAEEVGGGGGAGFARVRWRVDEVLMFAAEAPK